MSLTMTNNTFSIENKVVLTKTANTLLINADQQLFTDIVNINARLSNIPTSGSVLPTPTSGDVFYDYFSVTGSALPGSGSMEDKVITYVCNEWSLTLK
jgi:hypothetical protein